MNLIIGNFHIKSNYCKVGYNGGGQDRAAFVGAVKVSKEMCNARLEESENYLFTFVA